MDRRRFLRLIGAVAPAAILAPNPPLPLMLHPTGIPFADPLDPAGVIMPLPYKEPSPALLSLVRDISACQNGIMYLDDDCL